MGGAEVRGGLGGEGDGGPRGEENKLTLRGIWKGDKGRGKLCEVRAERVRCEE